MSRINDLVNQIATYQGQLAMASQELAKEVKATRDALDGLDAQQAVLDKVNKELAEAQAKLADADAQKHKIDKHVKLLRDTLGTK